MEVGVRIRIAAYIGLLITLLISKVFPLIDILPYLFMLLPMIFMKEEDLGFRNYKRGLVFGSFFLPLFLIAPPDLSCPAWILNQLGVATAEEVFFRGFLMSVLGNVKTSLLFSLAHLIHFPTINSLLIFFPSLIFGYAYLRSGSILAPILLHFTANVFYASFAKEFPQFYHLLQRQLTGG